MPNLQNTLQCCAVIISALDIAALHAFHADLLKTSLEPFSAN